MTDPGDERIREAAQEVLAREAYAEWRFGNLDWIYTLREWLEAWSAWLRDLGDTSPLLLLLVLLGMLVVAGLLIAHLVWSMRVAMRGNPAPAAPDATPARPEFTREATRLAEAGDWLGASRALQLACIEVLLRRGTLELARHHGNTTLRARLRRSNLAPGLRDELIAAIDALERSWFRDRRSSASLYDEWQRLHRDLAGSAA